MCEILGISARKSFAANDLLESFFNHGSVCRDGWGLAVFRGNSVTMEKEPVCALESAYLKHRLTQPVEANNLFAHIRKATLGRVEYANCHPFIWDDSNGRTWTLVHNGTVFESRSISPYVDLQEGSTDSERILMLLVDRMNSFERASGHSADDEERFRVIDDMVVHLSVGNKLNLLIFDGTFMYVHTNCPDTLYKWQNDELCVFATVPIRFGSWMSVPMNQMLAYRNGTLIRKGTKHLHVFYDEEHDYSSLFGAFSEL